MKSLDIIHKLMQSQNNNKSLTNTPNNQFKKKAGAIFGSKIAWTWANYVCVLYVAQQQQQKHKNH